MNQLFNFIQSIFKAIANVLTTVVTIALQFLEFVFQAAQFIVRMGVFLLNSQFFTNNFRIIIAVLVIGLSHNLIIINEEILVAFCFLAAVGFLYSNLSDSVTESLDERADGIRKELSTFLLLKQENLNELYKSEESFLNTTQNLAILQKYCQEHFVHLDQNQQKALVGLVAQNLHSKLDALQVTKKSLQPALHSQMNGSFRESVLEEFTQIDSSEFISESLEDLEVDLMSESTN